MAATRAPRGWAVMMGLVRRGMGGLGVDWRFAVVAPSGLNGARISGRLAGARVFRPRKAVDKRNDIGFIRAPLTPQGRRMRRNSAEKSPVCPFSLVRRISSRHGLYIRMSPSIEFPISNCAAARRR